MTVLAEVPAWIGDVGKVAASVGASLATLGAFLKLPLVQRELHRRREAVAHEQRQAHTEIVRGVLDEHVTPKIDALTVTVDTLKSTVNDFDGRLTAHMAEEEQRLDRSDEVPASRHDETTRRLAEVEEQVADHLRFHPPAGPKATA